MLYSVFISILLYGSKNILHDSLVYTRSYKTTLYCSRVYSFKANVVSFNKAFIKIHAEARLWDRSELFMFRDSLKVGLQERARLPCRRVIRARPSLAVLLGHGDSITKPSPSLKGERQEDE